MKLDEKLESTPSVANSSDELLESAFKKWIELKKVQIFINRYGTTLSVNILVQRTRESAVSEAYSTHCGRDGGYVC